MRGHRSRITLVNAVPVTVFLLVLFVYPIVGVLSLSLKGDDGGFTLHWYADALSGVNLSVLVSTLRNHEVWPSALTRRVRPPAHEIRAGQADLV